MPTKTRQTTRSHDSTSSSSANARGRRGNRPTTSRQGTGAVPDQEVVQELVLQALETELGGVQVYDAALQCVENGDLRSEWMKYRKQTEHHVEVVEALCQSLGIDADEETPGRLVVRHLGESLVAAMEMARGAADAQVVAAECVTLAETKDHGNWSLLNELAQTDFEWAAAIKEACDEVEDEEDEHLYHTMGWARELWIDCLGLPAALPPPEEEEDVRSMAQAAKAKGQRKHFAKKGR